MTPRSDPDPGFLTVSNLLSLTRIPLGLSLLALEDRGLLLAVITAGAATDLADGLLARWSGTESEIGSLLDPFCDKFFVLVGLISFLPGPHLDWAGFLVLVLRDVFTGGSWLLARVVGRRLPFRSRFGGKVTTGLQVGTFFALILVPRLVPLLVLAVGAASVWAIADYGLYGIRHGMGASP